MDSSTFSLDLSRSGGRPGSAASLPPGRSSASGGSSRLSGLTVAGSSTVAGRKATPPASEAAAVKGAGEGERDDVMTSEDVCVKRRVMLSLWDDQEEEEPYVRERLRRVCVWVLECVAGGREGLRVWVGVGGKEGGATCVGVRMAGGAVRAVGRRDAGSCLLCGGDWSSPCHA